MRNNVITTVVTPAVSTDLTTLLNLKSELKLSGSVPADDIYLRRAIKQATASAQNFCNRVFAQQTYQDLIQVRPRHYTYPNFLPNRRDSYLVSNGPLVSVTSVNENGTVLVSGTDFEVDVANGILYRLDSFGNPTDWVTFPLTIVYVGGYTLPPASPSTLPPDLEDAVIRMIKSKWFARDRDPMLKEEDIAGIGREVYWIGAPGDGSMTPDVTDILDNYRIPAIG